MTDLNELMGSQFVRVKVNIGGKCGCGGVATIEASQQQQQQQQQKQLLSLTHLVGCAGPVLDNAAQFRVQSLPPAAALLIST